MNMEKVGKICDVVLTVFVGIALAGIFYMCVILACRTKAVVVTKVGVTTTFVTKTKHLHEGRHQCSGCCAFVEDPEVEYCEKCQARGK